MHSRCKHLLHMTSIYLGMIHWYDQSLWLCLGYIRIPIFVLTVCCTTGVLNHIVVYYVQTFIHGHHSYS